MGISAGNGQSLSGPKGKADDRRWGKRAGKETTIPGKLIALVNPRVLGFVFPSIGIAQ